MNDYQFGAIIGSLVVGVISGAIPLVIGINKKQLGLGIGGFIICVVSGLILGLILAIPMCILFVWLISNASKKQANNARTKKCPYCAEIIKEEAIVCRHCGKELQVSSQ